MPEFKISDKFDSIIESLDINLHNNEFGFFSDHNGDIKIDKSELNPYTIKPMIGKSFTNPFGWNTKLGNNSYTPKSYKPNESTMGNFLDYMIQISNTNNDKNNDKNNLQSFKIFSQSSFFQYISVKRDSEFYIIYHNKRFIIMNAETRIGQNSLMSYAGIRFEDLLTHDINHKTVNNFSTFQSVLEIKINGIKCLYNAEIDSINSKSGKYTEIKMILCKSNIPHAKTKDKLHILSCIQNGNSYFDSFLFRLLIQCKFANISNVVIGIRDQSFTIRNITEFSVENDLLPFFLKKCDDYYCNSYLQSTSMIKRVLDVIKLNVNEKSPIYKLKIVPDYVLKSIDEPSERKRIMDTVFTPEFKTLLESFV